MSIPKLRRGFGSSQQSRPLNQWVVGLRTYDACCLGQLSFFVVVQKRDIRCDLCMWCCNLARSERDLDLDISPSFLTCHRLLQCLGLDRDFVAFLALHFIVFLLTAVSFVCVCILVEDCYNPVCYPVAPPTFSTSAVTMHCLVLWYHQEVDQAARGGESEGRSETDGAVGRAKGRAK